MGVKVMKINRLPKGNPGFITPKGVLWCRMAQEGDGRDKRAERGRYLCRVKLSQAQVCR